MSDGFVRANILSLRLRPRTAHQGTGQIKFCRVLSSEEVASVLNFVDFAVLPPGVSIGRHRHAADEEEFYLVLSGSGEMHLNGERFRVQTGDLIRNPPLGEHSLLNDGIEPLKLFVFENKVPTP